MMIYPTSIREPLIRRVEQLNKSDWFQKPEHLPDPEVFQLLVDVAFHASLMTEEKRRTGFRLLFCNPEDLKLDKRHGSLGRQFRVISMPSSQPLTASELNRIAPAADLTRFLICVHAEKKRDSLQIWGLLDVGANWWKFLHHEASGGMVPPNFLTITSTAPGELSFSVQGTNLLMLRNGQLSQPMSNPIWSGPISGYLEPSRKCLYDQTLQELKTDKYDEDGHDDEFPSSFCNFFLERILYNIRYLGHGGTLILVPQEIGFDDPRLTDRILIKYPTDYDYAWSSLVRSLVNQRRYYDLYFPLTSGEENLTKEAISEFTQLGYKKDSIEEEIQDIAKSIASLSNVDGALVITTKFGVLGFGGEIVAASPTLKSVTVASSNQHKIPIESFGTRHRSAFRFCSSLEESVAFIVSSDGGVKATKRHGREVLFWPDINEGAMGL